MNAFVLDRAGTWTGQPAKLHVDRKKLLMAAAATVIAAAALTYSYHWATVGRFVESTDDAYVGGDVTSIAPHVAGFVGRIDAQDNQHVRKGQLLMELDDRDYRATVDHAAAVVGEAKAALTDLQAKYTLQQSTIAAADATLAANLAQASYARNDDARYRGLMASGATSKQDLQKAVTADTQAQSSVASARAGSAGARQQLVVLAADIDQARANVAQAEADLRTARLNLDYTKIRAPIDGYVGNRAAQVGAYVTVGAYLASVIPEHGLWVDANFKEDQLGHIRAGQSATVSADVMPGREFHGRVLSVAPGTGSVFSIIPPENATGNFTKIVQRVPVRIELDPDDARMGGLRPGLSITADIDTRS